MLSADAEKPREKESYEPRIRAWRACVANANDFLSLGRSVIQLGIGVSLLLIAAGAIITFAIHVSTSGSFNLHTIGIILMVVGAIGALLSMMFWSSWGGFGGTDRETVIRER